MRLIIDENISPRLKELLPDWEILTVSDIPSQERITDLNMWLYARKHVYTVLTIDEGFSEIQNIHFYPPKIIWLRTGNTGTSNIAFLLLRYAEDIQAFLYNDELGVFEIRG